MYRTQHTNPITLTQVKLAIVKKQVCLLMPMDRTTLPCAKSTISRCTTNVITRLQALRAISKAHCYTDRHLSVISTYIHCKALDRFVVDILYKQVCNKKLNRWSWSLSALASSAVDARNRSIVDALFSVNSMTWWNFSKYTVACAKIGCVSPTTPRLEWFVIHLARLDIISICIKFDSCNLNFGCPIHISGMAEAWSYV